MLCFLVSCWIRPMQSTSSGLEEGKVRSSYVCPWLLPGIITVLLLLASRCRNELLWFLYTFEKAPWLNSLQNTQFECCLCLLRGLWLVLLLIVMMTMIIIFDAIFLFSLKYIVILKHNVDTNNSGFLCFNFISSNINSARSFYKKVLHITKW